MSLLKVENVTLSFGGLKAVNDITFSVDRGEVFSVIGPNGAGKTSLFNCISGFYIPLSGSITFEGVSCIGLRPYKITRMGMIRTFQNLRIFGNMTVEENVMTTLYSRNKANVLDALFNSKRHKREEKEAKAIACEYLDMVGMVDVADRMAKNLPYGMQKRLEIARAMAIRPKMIMLDEPAAGLNHEEKEGLTEIISKIKNKGVTTMLIEHDMGLVMKVSEKIIVLNYGEKIAEGVPSQIRNNQLVIEAYLGREN